MASHEPSCIRETFPFGKVMAKLIQITDVIETKLRKEKELEFYQKELEKLKTKMFFIQKDIEITNLIIDMIENEKVADIVTSAEDKLLINKDESE